MFVRLREARFDLASKFYFSLATLAAIADTVLGRTEQNEAIDLQNGFIVSHFLKQLSMISRSSDKLVQRASVKFDCFSGLCLPSKAQ